MSGRLVFGFAPVLVAAALILPSDTAAGRVVGDPERGRDLFVESCASCHGDTGVGTRYGPSLVGVGAASADLMLRTGRMPLADPNDQAIRKPPAFDETQIADLVAYVDSLGDGPAIPEVDLSLGDLPLGQELFVNNCAPCHGATGNGGAVGQGTIAPSLMTSSSLDVAEAMLVGPGEMPRFSFEADEVASIARYLRYIQQQRDPGGADLGQIGPVPEGFVAWIVGMGAVVTIAVLLGRRKEDA